MPGAGATLTGCERMARGETGVSPPLHDLLSQRCKSAHELLLLPRRYPEFLQRPSEVLHERIEVPVGNAHPAMHALHVATGVETRASAGLADLLDQEEFQPGDIGVGEKPVNAAVARDIADEVFDHGIDCRQSP